jgi:hypothetical protein
MACKAAFETAVDPPAGISDSSASTLAMAADAAAGEPHSTSKSAAAASITMILRLQLRRASHAVTREAALHVNTDA